MLVILINNSGRTSVARGIGKGQPSLMISGGFSSVQSV